jgi:hypothetical protein
MFDVRCSLLAVFISAFSLQPSAFAQTPVTLSIRDATGSPLNLTTIFTPQTVPGVAYPNINYGGGVSCVPQSGSVVTNLLEGPYSITFVGNPRTLHVFVPDFWATNIPGMTLPINLANPRWQLNGFQLLFVQTNYLTIASYQSTTLVTNFYNTTNLVFTTNFYNTTNLTWSTNFYNTTNLTLTTNFNFTTNLTLTTNFNFSTNLTFTTNIFNITNNLSGTNFILAFVSSGPPSLIGPTLTLNTNYDAGGSAASQGAANTNDANARVLVQGASSTNFTLATGLSLTNLIATNGINGTNFTLATGLNLTNLIATNGINGTNFSRQTGTDATNHDLATGLSLTNLIATNGINGTNFARQTGTDATNFTQAILNATNTSLLSIVVTNKQPVVQFTTLYGQVLYGTNIYAGDFYGGTFHGLATSLVLMDPSTLASGTLPATVTNSAPMNSLTVNSNLNFGTYYTAIRITNQVVGCSLDSPAGGTYLASSATTWTNMNNLVWDLIYSAPHYYFRSNATAQISFDVLATNVFSSINGMTVPSRTWIGTINDQTGNLITGPVNSTNLTAQIDAKVNAASNSLAAMPYGNATTAGTANVALSVITNGISDTNFDNATYLAALKSQVGSKGSSVNRYVNKKTLAKLAANHGGNFLIDGSGFLYPLHNMLNPVANDLLARYPLAGTYNGYTPDGSVYATFYTGSGQLVPMVGRDTNWMTTYWFITNSGTILQYPNTTLFVNSFPADTFAWYFVTGPAGTNFAIDQMTNGVTWVPVSTNSTMSGTVGSLIVGWTNPAVFPLASRVRGLTNGQVIVVGSKVKNSAITNGIMFGSYYLDGGPTPNLVPDAIRIPIWNDMALDCVLMNYGSDTNFEIAHYATNYFNYYSSNFPGTEVMWCGLYPPGAANNTNVTGLVNACLSFGYGFFDGLNIYDGIWPQNWTNNYNRGLMDPDGVHATIGAAGGFYFHGALFDAWLDFGSAQLSPLTLKNGSGITNHLGFATNTPVVMYLHVTNHIGTWTDSP